MIEDFVNLTDVLMLVLAGSLSIVLIFMALCLIYMLKIFWFTPIFEGKPRVINKCCKGFHLTEQEWERVDRFERELKEKGEEPPYWLSGSNHL